MIRRRQLLIAGVAGASAAQARLVGAQSGSAKTLRVCFLIPETGFDPAQVQDYYSNQIIAHIFEAPLRYDFMARPVKLVPNTAAALPEVSDDFRTFTVRLQPGILFQDDPAFGGKRRELVAADYVYSIKRVFDPRWKSQVLFILEPARIVGIDQLRQRALRDKQPFDYRREIDGLRVLDRYTFQVRLEQPNPRFVYTLAVANPLGAVAREVVEMYSDRIMEHPIGTGPFRLAQWTRTLKIVLERNPTYREEIYDFPLPDNSPQLADDVRRLRGRRIPLVDRVEVSIIQEAQPRLLSFEQGNLDHLLVPIEYGTLVAPNGKLAPNLARRGVRLDITPMADLTMSSFNMEDPLVGGYTPERVALRRAISLAFDTEDFIRQIFRGYGVPAQSPIVPGTFGYDPTWHTAMSEYSPAKAKALLDTYGYIDRNADGWREQPDGSPLILEKAASPSELDRRQSEQWRRYMTAIGLRIEFRVQQWPELVKQSLAGTLMIWNFAWNAGEPDSDLFFSLAYGPNKGSANDAQFALKAYDELYVRQRTLPDGPERLAAMREASRLLVAYMPYKFHLHRVQLDLAQPWLIGYRRFPFTTRQWAYLDIDGDATARSAG
ncbi:MAG: ABC transporter substrate-binding protein [Burkholderiaceae bacterium]